MVELLDGFPAYVAAYQAFGTVGREEYERVVMKRVDEVASRFGSINFLVKLETGMENYSVAALIDYLKISFKHIRRWNRMAIVSDQKTVRAFYDALSPLVPGKIIGYELKNFEKAKTWVSEPALTDENVFLKNRWITPITAGLTGTSVMSLYSYLASKLRRDDFREPVLLGNLLQSASPSLGKSASRALGWQIHYTLGIAWGILYAPVRSRKHPVASALLFGSLGGVLGILTWKKAFQSNPKPPDIAYGKFYRHLFLAHLVFALTTEKTYSAAA